MVLAGVTIEKKSEKKLKALGVKDSKELTPKKREEIFEHIDKMAKNVVVLKVGACKIDSYRKMGVNLDKIEAMKMAEIIDFTNSSLVYIDSLTHNPSRFKSVVSSFVKNNKNVELVVDNYMDESVIAVSAASIVAKVHRDREIKEIEEKVGRPIGVGYSHDAVTIQFVEQVIKESKGELPDYIRKSWVTTELLQEKAWQKKVMEFFTGKRS
ncbi:MAG: ribonuclease HII [Candidatus Aenigmarchaeota archaeon]|nr:ribonuclease HII [Candidatus Aenigmarchaeota archaeon]